MVPNCDESFPDYLVRREYLRTAGNQRAQPVNAVRISVGRRAGDQPHQHRCINPVALGHIPPLGTC